MVVPAVTMVPPWATATPAICCAAAAPKTGVCRHEAPSADAKATSARPACPLITAPSGPPLTGPAVNPAGVLRVAWNVHRAPSAER